MRQKYLNIFQEFEKKLSGNIHTRAMIAIQLFDFLDLLKLKNFPSDWMNQLSHCFDKHLEYDQFTETHFDFSKNSFSDFDNATLEEKIETTTGEVYFNLWKNFSKEEYYSQAKSYLEERLSKNNLSVNQFENVLDDGCGSGRYSLALKALGCKKVTGVDISHNSVEFAQKMNPFGSDVNFKQASVLELPFEDNSFDFILSNGVLHHTTSTEKGLLEAQRVLQPGGQMWLYLYGGKESLFWDLTDLCRTILKDVPQSYTQQVMTLMGYPPGRVFHRLDFFYVPIHRRYNKDEVESLLDESNFKSYKKLNRGIEYDWDEIKFENPNIDPYIYGQGEMRYWVQN